MKNLTEHGPGYSPRFFLDMSPKCRLSLPDPHILSRVHRKEIKIEVFLPCRQSFKITHMGRVVEKAHGKHILI